MKGDRYDLRNMSPTWRVSVDRVLSLCVCGMRLLDKQ